MGIKGKIVAACALLVVILSVWFVVLPKLRFSTARNKYALGMSLEKAKSIAKMSYETEYPAYPVSLSGEIPEAAKQSTVVVALYCPKESVVLGFNSYSNLIEIQPVNDLLDEWLWLRSRK